MRYPWYEQPGPPEDTLPPSRDKSTMAEYTVPEPIGVNNPHHVYGTAAHAELEKTPDKQWRRPVFPPCTREDH